MNVFGRQQPKRPMPGWLKLGLILFLVYVVYTGYQGAKDPDSELQLHEYPALQDFLSVTRWQTMLDPGYGREIQVSDKVEGVGAGAACGQTVTLRVQPLEVPEGFAVPDAPLRFRLGAPDAPPVYARAVRGMGKEGVRYVRLGPRLIDPQADPEAGPDAKLVLELEAITPFLPDTGPEAAFSWEDQEDGRGVPVSCGDVTALAVRLLDKEGAETFRPDEPLVMTVGEGALGHGIDRGIIGLKPYGVRRLRLPPPYQPQHATPVPFPSDDIAIVEIQPLPYNNGEEPANLPENPIQTEKELQDGADR